MKKINLIVRRFEADRNLDKLDTIALNAFARDYDLFLILDELVRNEGAQSFVYMSDRGNFSATPFFDMRNKMERQMYAWMREFGLTMASRGKIKGGEEIESDTPLLDYGKGGKDD